jgi:Mn-dependent DtxR family transcriptional regulator
MNEHKQTSVEKYLEAILILSRTRPVVRCVDIANKLSLSKSSVSFALKNLKEKHYITVNEDKFIYLTEHGREIAELVYERNEVLHNWLIGIGVDKETAAEDANRIKYVISAKSIEAIKNL